MMFESFREWIRIPISEALLIGASGGVLGWYGSRFDITAIVGALLLARFRGRGQSVVGAFAFNLLALVSAMAGPRFPLASADLAQVVGAASAICCERFWPPAANLRRPPLPETMSGNPSSRFFTAGCGSHSLTELWSSRVGVGLSIRASRLRGYSHRASPPKPCIRMTASAGPNTGEIC